MSAEVSGDALLEIAEPLGHAPIVRGLWRAARTGRLPHALLFHGPAGVGKFRAALWLANGLVCAEGVPEDSRAPCGVCGPCKRLRSGNHPDVFVVDVRQEEREERSEELRIGRFVPRGEDYWKGPAIAESLALKAAEGGWRTVLVREMERANTEAQNAILKMLEEPAERVLWILECSSPNRLLPTIKSRCIQVAFERLEEREVIGVLLARGVPEPIAAALARWSSGSPGEALRAFAQRQWELRELLLEVLRGRASAARGAAAIWELEGDYEGRTAKALERARLRAVLDLALALLRDLARSRAGVEAGELAHGDVVPELSALDLARGEVALERALTTLLALRRDLEVNVDPPALLDRALISLAPRPQGAAAARKPVAPPS